MTNRVLYWKEEARERPWKCIPDTPEARQEARNKGAMYFTLCTLSQPYDENGPEPHRWGNLVLDFDDAEDPARARADVMRLVAHLEGAYGVSPYQLGYAPTGSKGFHVEIPALIYGGQDGDPHLPLIFRRMAARLAADVDLPTLDLGIYNMKMGRMIRIPNVKRSNGRYKVPVSYAEMRGPVSEVLALTAAPRELDEDDLPEPATPTGLENLFQQAKEAVHREIEENRDQQGVPEAQRELFRQAIPSCIAHILERMPPKSETVNFNRLVLQLVSYFRDAGYDGPAALDVVKGFLDAYPHSESYPTPQKRKAAWMEMWRYLEKSTSYPFGCSFMLGLKFPAGAFECKQCPCNPDRKPTRAELEERIKDASDPDELKPFIKELAEAGLSRSETQRLSKMLARKMDCTVKDIKADMRAATGADDQGIVHLEYAREVIAGIGAPNVLTTSQGIWRWYERGVWRLADDREVKQVVHRVMPMEEVTKGTVDSVFDLFKTETHRAGLIFDQDRRAINCLNGELHWTGETWELRPHCRESYRTTQIPVEYDPAATAPRFVQFLNEVFRDEPDLDQRAELVCQMIGYTLLASCEFEKFIILFGPGANGKSVLMEIIRALIGTENVCAVQPSQFENKFQRAHLAGKLANLVTEIAEGAEIADAQLKAIVSGELTTAEHKHKPPFDFQPFATCWFGTNHLPHTRDFSDALFRRAFILTFNRTFSPSEQDPRLKEKLVQELPGILNLALSGIADVLRSGQFTVPPSCEQVKREWRVDCDQVAQFIEECCTLDPKQFCSSSDLYAAYQQWAEDAGVKKALNRKNFTSRLLKHGVKPYKGTGGTRMLSGVRPTQFASSAKVAGWA